MSIGVAMFVALHTISAPEWTALCEEVPRWPKGQEVPPNETYQNLATPVDGAFVQGRWKVMKEGSSKEQWVIIDTRSKPDRSVGKIPRAVLLTSDYHDVQKHEIKDAKLIKKVNKRLKKQYASIQGMQDVRFILFCNGRKCHRSSFAACELRRMGVPKDHIFVMLGGFPEWKSRGFPVR